MLPWNLKLLVRLFGSGALRQSFFSMIDRSFPGVRAGSCRKRYIDEKLHEALRSGIDSLVILGSGLDTRPYRLPRELAVKVYEVDLPETIAYKARKLKELYGFVLFIGDTRFGQGWGIWRVTPAWTPLPSRKLRKS